MISNIRCFWFSVITVKIYLNLSKSFLNETDTLKEHFMFCMIVMVLYIEKLLLLKKVCVLCLCFDLVKTREMKGERKGPFYQIATIHIIHLLSVIEMK